MTPREKFVAAFSDFCDALYVLHYTNPTDDAKIEKALAKVEGKRDSVLAAYDQAARPVAAGPDEPTEEMVIAGFESEAWDALRSACPVWPYSCREAAECVRGIYKAMRAARGEGAG